VVSYRFEGWKIKAEGSKLKGEETEVKKVRSLEGMSAAL
jgi:hypothetical protein